MICHRNAVILSAGSDSGGYYLIHGGYTAVCLLGTDPARA